MKQLTVSSPNADVDVASNDSSGRMLYRIRRHAYVMCSCRLDGGDCVAINRVWQQILFHNWCRSVFSVSAVAPSRQRYAGCCDAERLGDAKDGGVGVGDVNFVRSMERPGHSILFVLAPDFVVPIDWM